MKDFCGKKSLTFRQAKRKSSSGSSEELLSVECSKSGSCKLVGQFSLDLLVIYHYYYYYCCCCFYNPLIIV